MTTPPQFGLSPADHSLLLSILEPITRISKVWVFGSRARGDFKPFSDLDLLIDSEAARPLLSAVREALQESGLPIQVDLVMERDLSQAYRAQVASERIVL